MNTYADVRNNKTISSVYAEAMASLGSEVRCDFNSPGLPGSTDQGNNSSSGLEQNVPSQECVKLIGAAGNVTYVCPGFHAYVGIPTEPGSGNHTPSFTASAGTDEAHKLCVEAAKGMAVVGWSVLSDDAVAARVKHDFEVDCKLR